MTTFFIVKSFGHLRGDSYDMESGGESGPFHSFRAAVEEARTMILRVAAEQFEPGELDAAAVEEALADISQHKNALLESETQFFGFEIQER